MKILVIGATGGIGHRLLPLLIEKGHQVVALHRKPEQAEDLAKAGALPHAGDIMTMEPADFARACEGCEAIVFSAGAAGSGLDRTTRIDGDAPALASAAARQAGIKRFYLVSAFPEAGRAKDRNDRFEHYMAEKKRADAALAATDLDWVILRPGTLVHEDGDGKVSLGPALTYGSVARGNVARVLAELLEQPEIRREIIELTDGSDDIAPALTKLRREP